MDQNKLKASFDAYEAFKETVKDLLVDDLNDHIVTAKQAEGNAAAILLKAAADKIEPQKAVDKIDKEILDVKSKLNQKRTEQLTNG
jgi:hypothetical protein